MSWEGKLEKIDDIRWEIPVGHKAGMRVPTRIYANAELLKELKQDLTLEQGSNVAFLGGIYKYSIVLPDGHQGYGFPIGGVAATDAEEGVISPGGVGYDINCLPGDTQILTPLGYRRNIEEVSVGDDVTVLNDHEAKPTEVLLTLDRGDQYLYEVSTRSGYNLRASSDHPILTRKDMVKICGLSEGDEIAIHPFKGVKYEDPEVLEIVQEDEFTSSIETELKDRDLLPLTTNNEKLPYLLKILGYLYGNGTVDDKNAVFYGQREDLEDIKEDISSLGYTGKIYEKDERCDIDGEKDAFLRVPARSLVKLLWKLGYPRENKTETNIRVPNWIMNLPKWMKRLFLASFFGAKMSEPKTSNGYNFYTPEVKLSRQKNASPQEPLFLVELQVMLEEFGVGSTVSAASRSDETIIYSLLVEGVTGDLLNLWENIGYEYNKKKRRLAVAAVVYLRHKKSIVEGRRARKKIKRETEDLSSQEVADKYSDSVNRRPVEKSIRGEISNARSPNDFIEFGEFLEKYTRGEVVYDEIDKIKKIEHDDKVYDFTVRNPHHNFVANEVVVSNCGVRLLRTDLEREDVSSKIRGLTDKLFKSIPSGVGSKSKVKLSVSELDGVLEGGARWVVENGYGWDGDTERLEENGNLKSANSNTISKKAKNRGKSQVGSLGSGNHFLEVQYVDEIFDPKVAKKFGISHEGQVMAMIHTGSRGFGHQVCSDNLRRMEKAAKSYGIELPDRELVNVPISSDEGQDYLTQMACAANFAWANRQMITHWTRESFSKVFNQKAEDLGMEIIYDVAHNIAKFEKHKINGSKKEVCVHRKGATRAFPPRHSEVPKKYQSVGQPILIPGNMGTASYVLVGTEQGMEETFASTAHGAGRRMSRTGAKREFWGGDVKDDLWDQKKIYVKATHGSIIAEEAPGAYKNIDSVVDVSDKAGIGSLVARLRPMGVAKG